MKPDKNPFLLIPLGAIRMLMSDSDPMKETSNLTQIYYLSIYTSAMKLNLTDTDAVMQYVYCGYRDPSSFTLALRSAWGRVERSSGYDPFFRGMIDGRLDYGDQGKTILNLCQKDAALMEEIRQWARVRQMLSYIHQDSHRASTVMDMVRSRKLIEIYDNPPYAAIDSELMANIWNRRYFLFNDEWVTLAMHLGICSKLGTKAFVATTKVEILCRMFGCSTQQELDDVLNANPVLRERYNHYSSRRIYERIRRQVFDVYHMREVGLKRRCYVSYRFDNDRDFITAIAAKDSKLQEEKRKKEQKALIKELFTL